MSLCSKNLTEYLLSNRLLLTIVGLCECMMMHDGTDRTQEQARTWLVHEKRLILRPVKTLLCCEPLQVMCLHGN